MSDERSRALAATLAQIERGFGKGSIMKMDGSQQEESLDAISIGSLDVDLVPSVGDLPRDRVAEIFGSESSGGTTLYFKTITRCQKNGSVYASIDAEYVFDSVYTRRLDVKIKELYLSQPDTGERALKICDTLVCSDGIDMAVIDSVTALVLRAGIEDEVGGSHVGLQACLMSQTLRKLTGHIEHANTLTVFINQVRMKISVMSDSPETATDGNTLKFHISARLDIRRTGQIKRGGDVIGNRTKIEVVKSKVAPPFRQAEFDTPYGEGISQEGELIDLGIKHDIVEKSGAWYSHSDTKIGQGRGNVRIWLEENLDITNEIDTKTRTAVGINVDITEDKLDDTDGERLEE